jgi:hypothetical protein
MEGDVKAHVVVVADVVALTSGVQLTVHQVLVGRGTVEMAGTFKQEGARGYWSFGAGERCPVDRVDRPCGIEAVVFFREMREPSFYLGFFGIRSVIPVADLIGVAMYETFQEDGRATEDERRGVAEACGAVA